MKIYSTNQDQEFG